MSPVKTSCEDHEGGNVVLFQQWDGEKWVKVDEIAPMKDFVWPLIKKSAAKYAKEQNITPRDCK